MAAVEPEPKPEPKPESRDVFKETAKEQTRDQATAQKDARNAADTSADGKTHAQTQTNGVPVPAGAVTEIKTEAPAAEVGDVLAATDIPAETQADPAPAAQTVQPAAQPIVQPVIAPVTVMLAAAQPAPVAANDQGALSATPTTSDVSDAEPVPGLAQPANTADQAAAAQTATQNLSAMPAQGVVAEAAAQQPAPAAPVEQTVAAAAPVDAQTAPGVQIAAVQAGETAKPQAPAETKSPARTDATESAAAAPEQAQSTEPGNTDLLAVDAAQPEPAARAETAPAETATPKAAPQAQPAAATNMAVHGAAPATQTQTAAPAAAITQHVEVSAEAAKPNVATLAVEISARSQSGARQFDIRLDPPELGRVEVRLSIDAAGKASAHLTAEQPQTLELLQKDATVLARALRDAGLDVSQNSLNFSLRHQNQDGSAHHGHARGTPRGMSLTATQAIEATPASASWRGDGRLDIRV